MVSTWPTNSSARSCPKRPCAVRPCSHSVALSCSYSHCLPPHARALPCPAAREPHCPAQQPSASRPAAPLFCTSRPAAARASRPTAAHASRSAAQCVAPCCSAQRAPCCTVHRAPCPAACGASGAGAARATATAGGGAAGSAGSAPGAGDAGGATGSAGGAAGAEGIGGVTGSVGGAARAGGAGPTTGRHCLSWQLQRLGVDSGGHCLSRTTPPLSSFASGFFSEPVQVVEALVFCVLHRGGSASESAAALGASESAVALGASESTAALGASESAAAPDASESTAALGARASPATGPSSAEALHTFTLDLGASRCFFRDCTTLTPLAATIPVSLADPTGGPVVARASTVLPSIHDVWVDTFIPGGQRVAICTCSRTGRHLATFTRRPGSSLYTLTTASAQVAEAGQVAVSRQVSASSPCPLSRTRLHRRAFPASRGGSATLLTPPSFLRSLPLSRLSTWTRDIPVPRLHSDRGGEFSSDLLAEFYRDEGIHQSCTFPASPQQNGIAEHRIGLIMEVARTSMIHVAGPHFLWPFVVRYPAHQLNLWPSVSSKLSSHTLRCVFLGFPTDAPPWQFYHPRECRVFSSQDITFDESVCFYRLHPHVPHPVPLAPLFLVPVPPPAEPLPPQGPSPSGVSQVDLLPLIEPLEISSESSGPTEGGDPAADDTAATRRSPRLETPLGFPPRLSLPPPQPAAVDSRAETTGAEPGGAETEGEGSGGAATGGAGSGGAATGGAGSWGAVTRGADSRGTASPSGGRAVGDPAGGPGAGQPPQPNLLETLLPQAIRAWIVRRGSPSGGGYGPFGAGAAGPGGTAGAGGTGGTVGGLGGAASAGGTRGAAGAGGARATSPRGATGAGGAGGAAGPGGAGAGGARGAGPGGARTGGVGAAGAGGAVRAGGAAGAAGARGTGAAGAGGVGATSSAQRRLFFYPQLQSSLPPPDSVLRRVRSLPSSTGLTPPNLSSPTDQSPPQLLPGSSLPAPAPHTEVTKSLIKRREPETCDSTPVRARRVARPRPPAVLSTHRMALRPSSVPQRVVLPEPRVSSLPHVPDPESDLARAASPTVTRLLATVVTHPEFESTDAFALVTELVDFAARVRLDYVASLVTDSESVCPPSIGGELTLSSDVLGWQTAMDTEMASWKSTGTYVDEVPPLRANIVDDMSIFRVKRLPGSPPAFNARYVARGFSQRQGVDFLQNFSPTPKMTTLRVLLHVAAQRDYELHSLDFSTAFLQGSLHEEIWLRRPPGFTGSFPAGTQWSLRRPVYGLRQVPREWHGILTTTLVAVGFAPSSADPLLFLRTDTTLPPFYVLMYVDDLVFATADTEALALLSSPQPTPLSTGQWVSAPPLDKSVEASGPYPELVGCLMYVMTCTRPDLTYPLSLLARHVAPGRHRKRLSQGYTFNLGSGSVSRRSTRSSSVLGSSCEAEIYAGAMAAQDLRWLTYLLTDLGERPRSPPVLFLARELQQCRQLRLSYVALQANIADVFTKALGSGDHQRFCTALGLVPTLPHLLVA
ncbi:unnamed protein product [Closterium sp. NIES-54]